MSENKLVQYKRLEDRFVMIERSGSRLMLDEIVSGSIENWVVATLEALFGRGVKF